MKKDINYMNDNELIVQINEIKKDIMNTRNRVLMDANKELLYLYFRIGKMIYENQKYGTDFINTLSTSLKLEFKDASGFSPRNLSRMKKFYITYKDMSNLPPVVAKLPWTHNCILIEKVKEYEKRIWYAKECIENGYLYVTGDYVNYLNECLKALIKNKEELEKYNPENGFGNYNTLYEFVKSLVECLNSIDVGKEKCIINCSV